MYETKHLIHTILSSAAITTLLMSGHAIAADNVSYTDSGLTINGVSQVTLLPYSNYSSLPPSVWNGDSNNSSNNTVAVNFTGLGPLGTPVVVAGGASVSGDANHNTVNFHNGQAIEVFGGDTVAGLSASYNTVNFYNGLANEAIGGVTRENLNSTVNYNTVNIYNGQLTNVSGGISTGTAAYNTVNIMGGTVGLTIGAIGEGSAVSHNTVNISGGTIGTVYGGFSGDVPVSYNTVNISGGQIEGSIYGGLNVFSDAINNTITVSGTPVFSPFSQLFGGGDTSPGDTFTGNTLNLHDYRGSGTLDTISNFQYYNFILPNTLQNGDTLITADNIILGNGITPNTVTGISIMEGGYMPQNGDEFILLSGDISGDLSNGDSFTMAGKKGWAMTYDFGVTKIDGESLIAEVLSSGLNPQTKAVSEGRIANLGFLNQGADLIAGSGILSSLGYTCGEEDVMSVFGTVSGSSSRYNSGSHVDVDGFSLMTGLAGRRLMGCSKLSGAAFLEAGWGDYDTHNYFDGLASVKGDGSTKYYGIGLLGRFDFAPGKSGNMYTDASLRVGHTKTDFSTPDLTDSSGRHVNYDSGAHYYGAHLGLGYLWKLSDVSHLDIYAKYLWTHVDSDSVSILGERVHFDAINSHHLRAGARFNTNIRSSSGMKIMPYAGAAYEYEFDSKARATILGYDVDAPEIKGGTGIAELGLGLRPASEALQFDLGVQGYMGKREGVSGKIQIRYTF